MPKGETSIAQKLTVNSINENTAFLILTAIAANVYLYLIGKIEKVFTDLKPESRIKRFLFRFIAVPAKWIKTGRKWLLNIYSQKPYHLFWQTMAMHGTHNEAPTINISSGLVFYLRSFFTEILTNELYFNTLVLILSLVRPRGVIG